MASSQNTALLLFSGGQDSATCLAWALNRFDHVEIVSEKTAGIYAEIFSRHGDGADRALMAGNSLRSDVVPAIRAGAWGVHVPHELTWALEQDEPPGDHPRFAELSDLGPLPDLVRAQG